MHRHFDKELEDLKTKILHMGAITEKMIDEATTGLLQRKDSLKDVNLKEEQINDLQIEVDEQVVKLVALYHPVADDLRFLIMASKIGGELERIADQAVNISQNTSYVLKSPPLKPIADIPIMADTARQMLRESLDAFMRRDVNLAQNVLNSDDKVDALKDQMFKELLTCMVADPSTIQRAIALVLISRNLERVGDHATNIAEEVIYLCKGQDVRHHHEEKKREVDKTE